MEIDLYSSFRPIYAILIKINKYGLDYCRKPGAAGDSVFLYFSTHNGESNCHSDRRTKPSIMFQNRNKEIADFLQI